jgi:hypothetical protein
VRSGRRSVQPLAVALALVPLALLVLSACVEGITPNCSDPATPCGPGASPGVDGSSEASPQDATTDVRDASASEAGDADADAPLDAPDGG